MEEEQKEESRFSPAVGEAFQNALNDTPRINRKDNPKRPNGKTEAKPAKERIEIERVECYRDFMNRYYPGYLELRAQRNALRRIRRKRRPLWIALGITAIAAIAATVITLIFTWSLLFP